MGHLNVCSGSVVLSAVVDGNEKCSFDSGRTRDVKVEPGHHTIRVMVYNDASEEVYFLNELSDNFEPGREYNITS